MASKIADPDGAQGSPSRAGLAWRIASNQPERRLAGRRTRGPAVSKRRDSIFRRALLIADAVAVLGAFLLTVKLSATSIEFTWGSLLALPILLTGAKISGLYDRDDALIHKTTLDEAPKLFHVATLCALVSWLAGGLLVNGQLDRRGALSLWLALVVLLIFMRTVARATALRIAPTERCLFIGDAAAAGTVRSKLSQHGGINAELVAQVDLDDIAPWSTDARSGSKLAEVQALARRLDVQRAIVAPSRGEGGEILDLVRTLKAAGVRVSILPRLLEVVGSSVVFDELHGVTLMGVRRFELTRSSAALKRGFDLLCASLGLLAVAPLMIAIAIAIKLDSGGPVFFRQLRVGRGGERFVIVKFRTMVREAESLKDALRDRSKAKAGLFKLVDDPRLTRVGGFLRRSAMDELPQLFNVLKGEMSLVGPRPLVVDEDLHVLGWHRRRLELTPGMTGHWQILGTTRVPLSEMAAIDYLYAANWTLWTDVKIILRTVPYVIGRNGI